MQLTGSAKSSGSRLSRSRDSSPSGLGSFIRQIAVVLAVGLLCLGIVSCSNRQKLLTPAKPENPLPAHSGNYQSSASIRYGELEATATIIQETPRACAVTFTSPPSLADMSFVFQEGVVDLGYKGLAFTFDPHSVPGGAVAKVAVSAINKAMKSDGVAVDYSDGALSLSGVMESGEFVLRLDAENGNLLKLLVPAEDLEIEFLNFTFLD
ncbi:hypothetical protein LJC63_08480 [Ruminococcaceae bacterium OttesenSCG-928-L11]|nr:hypothetical protein [Ruminococcaceae bacterium OttesenSCG-928-L11]